MKKLIIIQNILFIIHLTAFSQSLSLTFNSITVKPDSVYIISCDASKSIVDSVAVNNVSDNAISVMVKKIIKDTLTGTLNFFCWKKCYNSTIYVSPDSILIYPGSTEKSFFGEYNPRGKVGSSTITYVFFDKNNKTDSSSITFNYVSTPNAIEKYSNRYGIYKVYPTPADIHLNISYNIVDDINNYHLIVYNHSGQKVSDIKLNETNGIAIINTTAFPNGIYYCSLINRNKTYSVRKFSVIH